jgi:hypothetical protein
VVLLECMSVLYANLGIHTRQRFTNLFGGSWEIGLGYETTKKRENRMVSGIEGHRSIHVDGMVLCLC